VPETVSARGTSGGLSPADSRVAAMRAAERGGDGVRSALRFARDVLLLVADLVADPAVGRGEKLLLGATAAYALSPAARIPGRIDGLAAVGYALQRLTRAAGYDRIYRHWRGDGEGLALVLMLAGDTQQAARPLAAGRHTTGKRRD
jgi:hypothetical protein